MGLFDTVIEDLGDITKDISATIGTTGEGHETESAEPTEEHEPPKAFKPTVVDINDIPPEWNRGVLYSGEEASEAAFELVKEEDIKELARIYRGSEILCDGRKQNNKDQNSKDASLGVHFNFNLPITEGFTAGAKADYSDTKHTAKCVENSSRSTLIAIAHGQMSFKNHQIKPTDEFLKDIKNALKTANTDKFETYDALQRVFQNYGGRATSTAEETSETDEQIKANNKEGGANLGLFGIGPNAYASNGKQIEVIRKAEIDKSKLIAYGGDGTVLVTEGIQKWAKTIRKNLKVVLRDKLKPMYDLLDEKTRQDVQDIYEFKEHKDHIRYNTKLSMKHADYGRYVYIDDKRFVRDNANPAKDVRKYRGKILYVYDEPESHGDPPPVMLKQIHNAGERRSAYAQFGHRVAVELLYGDKLEPIQMSQLPFDRVKLLHKIIPKALAKGKAQHKYVVASVYQSPEEKYTSKSYWWISTPEGYHEKEDFVKMEGEITFRSYIIDPKNAGIYLCLAEHGTKPDKMVSVNDNADGRYVAGKLCSTPMDKESQVAWKFVDGSGFSFN
ncbi:hypothetical protein DFQ28_010102 [Apophysomyces sp. BC1034]|nr:hypothetical protein DFQ30_001701 [Apophysomyces sp. BC1015]KAG0192103.1 hypothetical protein DFQ28_010102 [Apophysomyces sp. BC1034]